jgi:ribosomal protein L34
LHIVQCFPLLAIRLCKSCHDEEHEVGLNLIEIFNEHIPIVEGGSLHGKYRADYIIAKKPNPQKITLKQLTEYLQRLQQRYPNEGFYIRKRTWKGKTLYILAKRKRKGVTGRIPLYFDLQNQKYYIDKRDLQTNPRLANYIIMVTLGTLGISQSIYANNIRRMVI